MARGEDGPGVIHSLAVDEPGPVLAEVADPLGLCLVVGEVELEIVAVGFATFEDLTVLGYQALDRWSDRVWLVEPEQSHQEEYVTVR